MRKVDSKSVRSTWWRYPVGIVVCFLIVSYSITIVSWTLDTFSFFISGFFANIINLFGVPILTAIAFYVMAWIIPGKRGIIGLIMFIFFAIMFMLYSILFFVGQNPLTGASFLISILAAFIGWHICKAYEQTNKEVEK